MATITGSVTLNPSGYTGLSNLTTSSSYPISNGYTDTDSTTYARLTLSASTAGYLYFTFDTSDIPSDATITSITAKARARVSSTSRVTSTVCQLYTGTTAKGSNTTFESTSSTNIVTLSVGSWSRSELNDLRMRIGGTGSSSSQSKYIYFYGAEVVVNYSQTVESVTVTSTLSGSGTINPSGATETYSGAEYTLTITPTNSSDTVTATKNGTDITSSLVAHYNTASTSAVLGTYSLISGGFNSGESYFQGIVGHGYDTTSTTTSNYYSSGSGTTAVFQYATPITLASNAVVTRLYMMANGHAESTSNSSEYMCVQLKSGSTELSEQYNFKSAGTSNSTQTIEATTLPTASQLASLVVECTLGYYGGAINGVTVFVEYYIPPVTITHYTYTYTVDGNATIAVTIGGATEQPKLYCKLNGTWTEVTPYKKVNGSWVLQSDVTNVFNASVNYIQG